MADVSPPPLLGIHHLTAVSARIRLNHEFYTRVMGMRLVKRSVNQDDVSAYHLFYADAVGSPGTDLTFFDWDTPSETRGTRSVVRTSLRVGTRSTLEWWSDRLREQGATVGKLREVGGRLTLPFEDPEGQRLALVLDGGEGDDPTPWQESPVPMEHQIRGLGPIGLSVPRLDPTRRVLADLMGMTEKETYRSSRSDRDVEGDPGEVEVHVFAMADGGAHAELHVAVEPELAPVRPGAGGVHHVAFRTPDSDSYDRWADCLREHRIPNSGKVDRYYFRSLYFREPAGILFEIATDGPGFAVDEPLERLGEELALPPFLEPRRDEIVRNLEPLEDG